VNGSLALTSNQVEEIMTITPQYIAKFGSELLVTSANPLEPRTVITLDEPPLGRWDRPAPA
jgi:hypothetical protein